jgi:hypothetical protein
MAETSGTEQLMIYRCCTAKTLNLFRDHLVRRDCWSECLFEILSSVAALVLI